ncbi:hypothetical protein BHE74_00027553 [Ensete ventricosum]|nr:hypothetical protein BHE74_00027553 [Ensete ventricosum]RZS10552.1 hypothetical protein BHM03_00041795 [Ensete ventricosum]
MTWVTPGLGPCIQTENPDCNVHWVIRSGYRIGFRLDLNRNKSEEGQERTNAVRSTRRTRRVSGSFSSRALAFQRSSAGMWGLRSRAEDSEKRPRTRRRGSRRRWKSDRGRGPEELRTVEQYGDTVTASEMRPRKEAVSPVDTVRRRGRSEEAVIAEGDGKRGSMEGSPNKAV